MSNQLLFPVDRSDGTDAAPDHIVDMAVAHNATLRLLHVAPSEPEHHPNLTGDSEGDGVNGDPSERRRGDDEQFVSNATAHVSRSDVTVVMSVEHGEPYQVITEYATEQGAGLVIMPTHGRTGLGRSLLRDTTERIIRRSGVPVLIIWPDTTTDLTYSHANILILTDGGARATATVTFGSKLTAVTDMTLCMVSAVNVATFDADTHGSFLFGKPEERASGAVGTASDMTTAADVETIRKSIGRDVSIYDGILVYTDKYDVNIVVMGTHGHTGFDYYMSGSVAEKLVRSSSVPVVAIRQPREE